MHNTCFHKYQLQVILGKKKPGLNIPGSIEEENSHTTIGVLVETLDTQIAKMFTKVAMKRSKKSEYSE